jgi:hypothetical protein
MKISYVWEGAVTEIHDDYFCANLVELTTEGVPEEQAELYNSAVDEEDRYKIQPGAQFYWVVMGRDKKAKSFIKFVEHREMSKNDMDKFVDMFETSRNTLR